MKSTVDEIPDNVIMVGLGLLDPPPHDIVRLEEIVKQEILNALRVTKGDKGAAALALGISRTTLYRNNAGVPCLVESYLKLGFGFDSVL